MRLARYVGNGRVVIDREQEPGLPEGGLLLRSLASGLCTGELMDWYMDSKVPHVLGHEVCGVVEASDDPRFPVGSLVAPHHHAPCGSCLWCSSGRPVHCPVWRSTRLIPGGLSEKVAVPASNLCDTHRVDDLRPIDAALLEPLGTVAKSIRRSRWLPGEPAAVVGLGTMGLLHLLLLDGALGIDLAEQRLQWAANLGLATDRDPAANSFDVVFVCPGTESAILRGIQLVRPGGRVVLFAPMAPGSRLPLDQTGLYFREVELIPSYSAGPEDLAEALRWLRAGRVRAEQVVSHFIPLGDLPLAYERMKRGEWLKAMVVFE
ncbi:MAG: alcohol dehydrogenase catalytic domain-containing protein [Fimbriimonadales bacterium]|nr:alcohol dehydrogenase catalytic domain-containing protein [Fimbriimonadales bacterium]